jgi:hypothetical protein
MQAESQLIGNRFADAKGTGVQKLIDTERIGGGWCVCFGPMRISAGSHAAGKIDYIFYGKTQTAQPARFVRFNGEGFHKCAGFLNRIYDRWFTHSLPIDLSVYFAGIFSSAGTCPIKLHSGFSHAQACSFLYSSEIFLKFCRSSDVTNASMTSSNSRLILLNFSRRWGSRHFHSQKLVAASSSKQTNSFSRISSSKFFVFSNMIISPRQNNTEKTIPYLPKKGESHY